VQHSKFAPLKPEMGHVPKSDAGLMSAFHPTQPVFSTFVKVGSGAIVLKNSKIGSGEETRQIEIRW